MAPDETLAHSYRAASNRGVSPVVGVVLLVALTTLLASTVGAFALGFGLVEPGPHVTTSTEPLVAHDHADGDREQRLRIRHEGGAPVNTTALTLVVTVERTGERARVTGIPVAANKLDAANVAGEPLLDLSHGEAVGSLSTAPPDVDGVWSAGDRLGVRIVSSAAALVPGDTVTVRVVHVPSGQIVASETLTAR